MILKKKMKIKKNVIKNENGFSLIELMVVLVILSFIILGLVTFFGGGVRSWISGNNQLRSQREARMAMDMMVKEIRFGQSVRYTFTENPNDSITVDVPPLGTTNAYSVTFSWSGTDGAPLQRVVSGTPNALLADIYSINFIVNGNRVDILLQMDLDDDRNPDISLNTDVYLRNKVM
jgi:prepilin-type N-terminal cleavage/methylation domain-containing protein